MKRGFILFYTLIAYVNLALILSSANVILQNRLRMLNRTVQLNEVYEIEAYAIERIKEEFMYLDTKNFRFKMHGCTVFVEYDELTAYIDVRGRYGFYAVLEYNDEYARVKDYYYPD